MAAAWVVWVWWKEKGQTFGHAVNCYYDMELEKVRLIEPQTDRVFDKPREWNTYLVIC